MLETRGIYRKGTRKSHCDRQLEGGFKWSLQRCCVSENVGDRQELRQVSSSLRFSRSPPGPANSSRSIDLRKTKECEEFEHTVANFVFINDKIFQLERTDYGTRFVHKELFSGLMVPMFWGSVESNVPAMLNSMNEALKRRVERNNIAAE